MAKLRVGVVSFLNAQPLWVALKGDPDIELVPDTPARLSDMMAAGELDLGVLPTFEALRLPDVELVRELGVAADGPVESVGIFTKLDEGDTVSANSVRMDARSRTSVALARIILGALDVAPDARISEVRPELFNNYPESALLLIGDDCLRARAMWPDWRFLDLSQAWHEWTGLPFVFAIWTARAGVLTAALRRKLADALERGLMEVPRLVSISRQITGQSEEYLTRYLTQTIRHRLDQRCVEGLREFAKRCIEQGLLPRDTRMP
jgi:chorismate dehydratase